MGGDNARCVCVCVCVCTVSGCHAAVNCPSLWSAVDYSISLLDEYSRCQLQPEELQSRCTWVMWLCAIILHSDSYLLSFSDTWWCPSRWVGHHPCSRSPVNTGSVSWQACNRGQCQMLLSASTTAPHQTFSRRQLGRTSLVHAFVASRVD